MAEQKSQDEHISVAVRLRPFVPHEVGNACFSFSDGDQVNVIPSAVPAGHEKEGPWKYDHALDSSALRGQVISNAQCYDIVGRSLLTHALEGFNVCLFCYGQTGTGKTTTVLGDEKNGKGVLLLLLADLFQRVSDMEQTGSKVNVKMQVLEVYNEQVFDLLANAGKDKKQKIELHVLPGGVQIKGAETKEVQSVDQCQAYINQANRLKHIAATYMNPQSSRGHTVFKFVIEQDGQDGIHSTSEMYFADLAGHENEKTTHVTGQQLVELSFINKSLMWLQSAIHALAATKKVHGKKTSPQLSQFRNSKLTLLLCNALTGDSLINVIVTVSPAAEHFGTSLSSLKFANEVKRIHIEAHSSSHMDPHVVIKRLEDEVKSLKEQLATPSGADVPVDNLTRQNQELREQLESFRTAFQELSMQRDELSEKLNQSQGVGDEEGARGLAKEEGSRAGGWAKEEGSGTVGEANEERGGMGGRAKEAGLQSLASDHFFNPSMENVALPKEEESALPIPGRAEHYLQPVRPMKSITSGSVSRLLQTLNQKVDHLVESTAVLSPRSSQRLKRSASPRSLRSSIPVQVEQACNVSLDSQPSTLQPPQSWLPTSRQTWSGTPQPSHVTPVVLPSTSSYATPATMPRSPLASAANGSWSSPMAAGYMSGLPGPSSPVAAGPLPSNNISMASPRVQIY